MSQFDSIITSCVLIKKRSTAIKKRACLILVIIAVILAVSAVLLVKHRQDVRFTEEIQTLQKVHPQYFGLDTSEGLHVLVYGNNKDDNWSIRLVSGSQTHYSIYESIWATTYEPISLDEAKLLLKYYDLPDDMVILHPYDDPIASNYLFSMLEDPETYLIQMAEAFDNRYQVGALFEVIYDPEIDGTMPKE